MSKERPILFSAPMVRAILDGRKTMTRRPVKEPRPDATRVFSQVAALTSIDAEPGTEFWRWDYPAGISRGFRCPYGQAGDRLWVRETWGIRDVRNAWCRDSIKGLSAEDVLAEAGVEYAASLDEEGAHWRPSIHMPRWAARITLEVTDVRVERLQAITEKSVYAEGVQIPVTTDGCPPGKAAVLHSISGRFPSIRYARPGADTVDIVRAHFASAWDTIHGADAWAGNPWVWAVSFKRIVP